MTEQLPQETSNTKAILAKIRLDYKGITKPGRFVFGGRSTEKAAEDVREQQAALFRNVPIQGISIEDIDLSLDTYTIYDEILRIDAAYAPVTLTIKSDTLEDLAAFISRDEFRKIDIIEPNSLKLSKFEIERLLFKTNEQFKKYHHWLERKYNER